MVECIEWNPTVYLPEKSGKYCVISNDGDFQYIRLDLHCSKCVLDFMRSYKLWAYPPKGQAC